MKYLIRKICLIFLFSSGIGLYVCDGELSMVSSTFAQYGTEDDYWYSYDGPNPYDDPDIYPQPDRPEPPNVVPIPIPNDGVTPPDNPTFPTELEVPTLPPPTSGNDDGDDKNPPPPPTEKEPDWGDEPDEPGADFDLDIDVGGVKTPQSVAPYATMILKNSNLSIENWELVEKMIEKILNNCLGNGLFNLLNSKLGEKRLSLSINLQDLYGYPGGGYFVVSEGKIVVDSFESHALFHELFHGLQAFGESLETWEESSLNQEVEAWIAQYLYVRSLPEYQEEGNKWRQFYQYSPEGVIISEVVEDYFDEKGNIIGDKNQLNNFIETKIIPELRKNAGYRTKKFDSARASSDNFKDLKSISVNCD